MGKEDVFTHTHTHTHTHTQWNAAAAAAKSLQSCPTLCDPIDGNPPGSSVPGILQTRTLEWVAISFSKAWKWKVKVKSLSRVQPFQTPWTAAYQAPPSMGFSRQEYWSGLPLPSPRRASSRETANSPFLCLSVLLKPQWISWCLPTLLRTIFFTTSTESNANFFQRHPHRHTHT